MTDTPHHTLAACVLVSRDNGDILLVKTHKRGWEVPGGQVELGESITDAALREVLEESGIICELGEMASLSTNRKNFINVIGFLGTYISGEPTPSDETPEVGWFPRDQVLNMITHPAIYERVSDLLTYSTRPVYRYYETEDYVVFETRRL